MKHIFKTVLVALTFTFIGCEEPETEVIAFKPVVYKEVFNTSANDFQEEDAYLNYNGWTSIAQSGVTEWTEQDDDDNGYIQFSTFTPTGQTPVSTPNDIAWAITPKINLDNSSNEILTFKSGRGFVSSVNNKMEVYISTDFDGTNFSAATWTLLNAIFASANNATGVGNGVMTADSGDIDLSTYSGDVYLGFKAYGSNTMTGSLRIDDVKIYDKTLK